jgi:glycine dehydrogenase subunit 1
MEAVTLIRPRGQKQGDRRRAGRGCAEVALVLVEILRHPKPARQPDDRVATRMIVKIHAQPGEPNRVSRRHRAVLSGGLHPHYRETVETYARYSGFDIASQPPAPDAAEDLAALIDDQTSCVVVQNPDVFGHVRDLAPLAEACHGAGALLVVVVTEVVSLGLMRPPGEMGADIVVCEGQSLGNPLGFGGPYVGLFATRAKHVRQMPGRLVGETADTEGRRGWVLTLSTREQHIRREKATSNICTNQGLLALRATFYLSLLGPNGLREVAELCLRKAHYAAERLAEIDGLELMFDQPFFKEFAVRCREGALAVAERARRAGLDIGPGLSDCDCVDPALGRDGLLVAVTEQRSRDQIDTLAAALA